MEELEQETVGQSHEAEIRAALERAIASPHLNHSPQLARFLRFVVEETLAGRGDRIKAYSIAADALGRDAKFDPEHDPIVRVSAGRLRRSLHEYYSDGGCDDPIIIELPLGNYVPVFKRNSGRRRVRNHLQNLRHSVALKVQESYRLVLLIAVVAAGVSLTMDFVWKVIEGKPLTIESAAPPNWPDATGSLKR